MEALKDIIQSVVSFLIVEAFILNLVSDKGFRKLIKMFCGILLILILLNPIGEFLGLADSVTEAAGKLELDQMYEEYAREIEEGNTKLATYYRTEYENAAKVQIQASVEAEGLYMQDCKITTDETAANKITGIRLVVSETAEASGDIKAVEEVVIAESSEIQTVSRETKTNENPKVLRIRNEIICMYGVQKEQIEIVEVK